MTQFVQKDKNQQARHSTHIAAMVNKARQVALIRCINNGVGVDAEQVAAANAPFTVTALTYISDGLSDSLANILNHHFTLRYWLLGKQTPVVDAAASKLDNLLAELQYSNKTAALSESDTNHA